MLASPLQGVVVEGLLLIYLTRTGSLQGGGMFLTASVVDEVFARGYVGAVGG